MIPQLMPLAAEKKHNLRKKTPGLKPIILLGNQGLTPNVFAEIEQALDHHELIKIRMNAASREDKKILTENICQQCRAHLIQSIGHIIAIYRENPNKRANPSHTTTHERN